MHDIFTPAAVLVIGSAACVTDLRTRRIPNVLTFGSAMAGLLFHLSTGGVDGAVAAVGGWLAGTLLFLPFFVLGGMGAGDVKLLAALGAWLGPRETLWLAMYSGVAGGLLGIGVALARGYLRTALRNIAAMLSFWREAGLRPVPELTLSNAKAPRIAYAFAIFAGMVVTLWL